MKSLTKPVLIIILLSAVLVTVFSFIKINLASISDELLALAEDVAPDESYFFPTYPQRLIYLTAEISQASEELVSQNEELKNSIGECNCQSAESQCEGGGIFCRPGPVKTFGEPCQNREEIRKKQSEISEKNDQITHLRNLLEKEMETGLERELKTLRPEVAQELKSNLEKIVSESQNIISPSESNQNLPENCSTEKCSSSCSLGSVFGLKACLMIGTGAQRQIELKFKAGISLDNLKLGKIGINNINLGLPKEIQLPKIEDLSVTIPSQEVVITFPQTTVAELQAKNLLDLSSQSFSLSPQFSLPSPPGINLSCPNLPPSSSYQCSSSDEGGEVESIEYRWYFQIFSYLSEQCQSLPGMTDQWLTEKAGDCFNPEKIPEAIVKECDKISSEYYSSDPPTGDPPPQICNEKGEIAAALQCQKLFTEENEPVPSSCTYETNVDSETGHITYSFPLDFDPIETLKNKCRELKDEKREDPPQSCEILPLFTGEIEPPKDWEYIGGGGDCSAQEINNFPASMLSCPASPPTLPKISLPKIIIPDIIMPYFRIPPFLEVKLPSFYFEDLVLPDINLCDLNDCANIFPSLNFKFPSLSLPQMKPSLRLPDLDVLFHGIRLKVPMPEIKTDINLPSIAFGIPNLSELNLGKLITPELSIPKIQLPKPKITFGFSGVGIDLSAIFELIITFILNALDIPDYGMCINFSATAIPIRITFPDYYFYWPAFPKIPEIPFCKDIQSFCKNIKTSLKGVTDKVGSIENILNQVFSSEIQGKLNQLSQLANSTLTQKINEALQGYSQMISAKVQEALGLATIENGQIKIPAVVLTLPEKKITINLSSMAGLPEKIQIPWPEELKKIKLPVPLSYDLPEIPLSKLSYQKEIKIKGPGFQPRTITVDLGALGNLGECVAEPPSGGNPCPQGEFQSNLENIKSIQQEINETSNKIVDILE